MLKKSNNKDLDEAVFTWFKKVCSNKIPVIGNAIKENTPRLAEIFELTDFQVSDGLID